MSNLFKVWSVFSVASKKSGNVSNFLIMDMPDYLRVDVVNLYMEYFVKEEAVYKAAGVPKSIKALNEVRINTLKATGTPGFHIMICCKDNANEQIKEVVGASMMALLLKGHVEPETGRKLYFLTRRLSNLAKKEDLIYGEKIILAGLRKIVFQIRNQWKFETQEVKKVLEIVSDLEAHFDETKVFNLDRTFSDRGAFVLPEFRGLGIAQEFLKARRKICKDHGIPIHGAWVTSYGMLGATERDGWDVVSEIPFEDLERKHGVTFKDENYPPSCKFKIARIDKNN